MNTMNLEDYVKKHGQTYEQYYENALSDREKRRWQKSYEKVTFNNEQLAILKQDSLPIHAIIITFPQCADSRMAVPIVKKMEDNSEFITLHILEQKEVPELAAQYTVNGMKKVPTIIFASNEYKEVTRWIERSALGYQYYYNAKVETKGKSREEFLKVLQKYFGDRWDEIQSAAVTELFQDLTKAIVLTNLSRY